MDSELSVEKLVGLMKQKEQTVLLKDRVRSLEKHKRLSAVAKKRVERKVAHSISSKEISKWEDTVRANREVSKLDLRPSPAPSLTIDSIVRDSTKDEMQERIDKLLGIEFEAIEDPKPVQKARSDNFFQYLKQKRISKIKSKLYHKIRKKQKVAPVDEETRLEQEEIARVQERITLKHGKSNKFKKSLLRYAKREHDSVSQALNQKEALRQRILRTGRVNESGNITYESSDEDYGDEDYLQQGIFSLRFMQDTQKTERTDEPEVTSKFVFDGGEKPTKKKKKEAQQQDIVKKAFAEDEMDLVAAEEWDREQQELIDKEPKAKKGWGNWAGIGIADKTIVRVPKFITEKTILNQEKDKRAAKYMVPKLPFPFKTPKQFDTVNRIPVGQEWNSKKVYQESIEPEVISKSGQIIKPISQDND